MDYRFDEILDECIDRISRGQSVEACLADYPDYAEQLEPLLRTMSQTQAVYSFVPSASGKTAARQRFDAARKGLEQKRREKQSFFAGVFTRPAVWATVAAVLVLLIGGFFGLRSVLEPSGTVPTQVSPEPDPAGNFVFLISDDVNAIDDFESLNVSIEKIGLLLGNTDGWIDFEPEINDVDLTMVKGDKTQEIWRGNIPEGQYNRVFVYITDVRGILKETGETVEIKLPSLKLHISKNFQVSVDTVTSFTYDLTVIATGNAQSGVNYILQPQADQSGADSKPKENRGKGKQK